MAIGGANISRGMGRGAAQVYDTSGPINTYAKLLQQQQLKREKENKLLQDELSKVSPEGIRQPDIPEFTTKYQQAKDIFSLRESTKDRAEKIKYDREYAKTILELKQMAEDSKNLAKGEIEFTKMLLNPNIRDRFVSDAVERFQRSKSLSRNDQAFVRDLTTLEQQIDASSTMDELNKIDNALISRAKPKTIQRVGQVGNKAGAFLSNVVEVLPEEQALSYSMQFDINPKFRAGIRQLYNQYENLSDEEFKSIVIPELVKQRPAVKYGEEKFVANRVPRATGGEGGGVDSINSAVVVRPKNFVGTKLPLIDKRTGKPILTKSGKPQLGGEKVTAEFPVYSAVNPTSFAMSQVDSGFNINKGANERLGAGTYKLTGIGYTTVKGGGKELKATIADEDNNEYVVSPSNLPADIRGDKYYKKVLKAVEDEFKKYSSSQVKPKAQTPKASQPNKVEQFKSKGGISFTVE